MIFSAKKINNESIAIAIDHRNYRNATAMLSKRPALIRAHCVHSSLRFYVLFHGSQSLWGRLKTSYNAFSRGPRLGSTSITLLASFVCPSFRPTVTLVLRPRSQAVTVYSSVCVLFCSVFSLLLSFRVLNYPPSPTHIAMGVITAHT